MTLPIIEYGDVLYDGINQKLQTTQIDVLDWYTIGNIMYLLYICMKFVK